MKELGMDNLEPTGGPCSAPPSYSAVPDDMIRNGPLALTCASCPTQVEGDYLGHRVYFRHRFGQWTLQVDGRLLSWGAFSARESDGDIGEEIATVLIRQEIKHFREAPEDYEETR